ncbi:MAG: hypothetical protein AAF639_45040 [Chloroflexota bacterium]
MGIDDMAQNKDNRDSFMITNVRSWLRGMNDPKSRALAQDAGKEYYAENLNFLRKYIELTGVMAGSDNELKMQKFTSIYNDYIGVGSKHEINIQSKTRKTARLQAGVVTQTENFNLQGIANYFQKMLNEVLFFAKSRLSIFSARKAGAFATQKEYAIHEDYDTAYSEISSYRSSFDKRTKGQKLKDAFIGVSG